MRHGTALPLVLFVLALTSGLAVSGVFLARRMVAASALDQTGARLEFLTEGALVDAIAEWDTLARKAQSVGLAVEVIKRAEPTAITSAWVTRIGPRLYWIVAESSSQGAPKLRRRIGVAVQVRSGRPTPLPERGWSLLP